jgi:hypothetical protein
MISELMKRLGASALLPTDYATRGNAFYASLLDGEAKGTLCDDIEQRGLALGKLRLEEFGETTATFVCEKARANTNRFHSVNTAVKAILEALTLIKHKRPRVTVGFTESGDHLVSVGREGSTLLSISFADHGLYVRVITHGAEGLGLAIAIGGRLGFGDGRVHYLNESPEPLAKVLKSARCSYHASSQRFVIELRADPGKIRHVRLVGGGECRDLSNGSEDIRCIVSDEHARPIIYVNNRELGETKGVRGTTEAMREALRCSGIIE